MSKPRQNLFEEKARKILDYLKHELRYDESFLPRPFFLEFTGSPAAGKTTTITELDKFLRRQGFRVLRPQEGAEVIRHIPRTTPLYNIRTALYALNMLVDLSHGHLYDVVIFDRCIFDSYVWMEYWQEKSLLTEPEKHLIQSFFLSPFWSSKIDIAYFMICRPDQAIEREQRIALTERLGETTNPETVKRLVDRYQMAFSQLSPDHRQIRLIDTTDLSEQVMIEKVAEITLDILENKAKSGN